MSMSPEIKDQSGVRQLYKCADGEFCNLEQGVGVHTHSCSCELGERGGVPQLCGCAMQSGSSTDMHAVGEFNSLELGTCMQS